MRASEVRGKVFADHASLGELLQRAGQHAWRAIDGDAEAGGRLCAAVVDLAQPLLRHLDLEETLMRPLLEPIAAWGPMDLMHMKVNHAHQREYMQALVEFAADPATPPTLLAGEVIGFVRELIEDMSHEERTLLHPDTTRAERVAAG